MNYNNNRTSIIIDIDRFNGEPKEPRIWGKCFWCNEPIYEGTHYFLFDGLTFDTRPCGHNYMTNEFDEKMEVKVAE